MKIKLKVVQVYGSYYLAPSPKGFRSKETADRALELIAEEIARLEERMETLQSSFAAISEAL